MLLACSIFFSTYYFNLLSIYYSYYLIHFKKCKETCVLAKILLLPHAEEE